MFLVISLVGCGTAQNGDPGERPGEVVTEAPTATPEPPAETYAFFQTGANTIIMITDGISYTHDFDGFADKFGSIFIDGVEVAFVTDSGGEYYGCTFFQESDGSIEKVGFVGNYNFNIDYSRESIIGDGHIIDLPGLGQMVVAEGDVPGLYNIDGYPTPTEDTPKPAYEAALGTLQFR
jgi:hypothetical protein